ncbi:MAG: aminotransferase class IV [Bacteroides sp.]
MKYIETIKLVDGIPCQLSSHLLRMERTVGVVFSLDLHTSLPGVVKCRVLYDDARIHSIAYTPYRLPHIESLQLIECPTIDYRLKREDRSLLHALHALRGRADEVLITQQGRITDTSFCNVVFESAEGLFTPRTFLLNGTQRRRLLTDGVIRECDITVDDFGRYRCIHLINALIELEEGVSIPIANISKEGFGRG